MEFVLIMPILMFLIMSIAQLSQIWLARNMVYYASYCGARAAMVYNPEDYSSNGVFYTNKGVVYRAAHSVLSYLNFSNDVEFLIRDNLWGETNYSRLPKYSPWARFSELVSIYSNPDDTNQNSEDLGDMKAVRVTVKFKFPLMIPFVSRFFSDVDKIEFDANGKPEKKGVWRMITGYLPTTTSDKDFDYITLYGTTILPKPVPTVKYPRVASEDMEDFLLE